ncbi:MAG: major facilitator superfamily MFS_1 [Leptospirillum sp. Group IV 'UBA BS']|nr:MAG: major facilitator superfamily MFS_1 [Leptospirillum sp. Group IV 'UBA BS']MCL5284615.1 MFS transporter [Nitrospirota bacterium]
MRPLEGIPVLLGLARGLRGIVQGYLVACFLPDLHALGWSSLQMGGALSGGLLADFLLTLCMGPVADRISPRRLLMAGEMANALSALPFLLHPAPLSLAIAIFLAGAGQRSNGSPGPWAPSEQVLLARLPLPSAPFFHFGTNMALGLLGMAAGAFLSGTLNPAPAAGLRVGLSGLLLLSLGSFLLAALLPGPAGTEPRPKPAALPSPARLSSREKRRLVLLVATNISGGLALGLVDPVIAYWFLIRFHAGPGETALFLALAYLSASLVSALLARMGKSRMMPETVLAISAISFVAGLLLPLSPFLGPAVLLYTVRLAGIKAPGGIRQALALSLVPPHRTGLAAGLHLSSLQAAQIAGPLIAGLLWQARDTDTPLILAGSLAGLSLFLFLVLYRSARLGEPSSAAVGLSQNAEEA